MKIKDKSDLENCSQNCQPRFHSFIRLFMVLKIPLRHHCQPIWRLSRAALFQLRVKIQKLRASNYENTIFFLIHISVGRAMQANSSTQCAAFHLRKRGNRSDFQ